MNLFLLSTLFYCFVFLLTFENNVSKNKCLYINGARNNERQVNHFPPNFFLATVCEFLNLIVVNRCSVNRLKMVVFVN